jgi:LysM repeat protein
MRIKKIVFSLICLNIACAFADNAGVDSSGAYFDIGLGASNISNLPTGAATANMNWGYNFNRGFALEAGWTAMPSSQWGMLDNYNVYDIAAKGTIPLSNVFDLYGRLGLGAAYSSWSGTCLDPMYSTPGSTWSMVGLVGVGVAFNLNQNFSLYLENNNYIPTTSRSSGAFGEASSVMFGFQYNFGSSHVATQSTPSSYEVAAPVASTSSVNVAPAVATISAADVANSNTIVADTQNVDVESMTVTNSENNEFAERIQTDDRGRYVVIRKGDTLASISCDGNIYISDLKSLNHMKNTKIVAGKKLYIGTQNYISAKDRSEFKHRVHIGYNGRHYVEAICGDHLYSISQLSGVSTNDLARINHLKGDDIHDVKIGQRIYLD